MLDKLQHIYDKHAADFGLQGAKNPEQLQKLREALARHTRDEGTIEIRGWYRGREAILFYNGQTGNVVVTTQGGDLVAAFKASEAQAAYIQAKRRLN